MSFNATLPDGLLSETDVNGMRQFLSTLITPKVHESFFIQMYVGAAIVGSLTLFAPAVIIRRMVTKSAWLFQLYHTPRGTFVIPNAVLTLVIFLVLYSFAYVAYALLSVSFYRGEKAHQKDYTMWRHSPWILIWAAAWCSSAASVSAFPDALRQRGRKIGYLQRVLLTPLWYHAALVCGPIICIGTLLGPIVTCGRLFNSLVDRHRSWLVHAADPSADIAELAVEARGIWLGITRVYWYDALIFGMWFAWGGILFVCFLGVAAHTLLRVRAQVKIAQKKKEALSRTQPTFYLFSSRLDYSGAINGGSYSHDGPHSIGTASSTAASPVKSPNSTTAIKLDGDVEQSRQEEISPELVEVLQTETTSVLFPALKVRPSEKLTKVQAAVRRSSALKLVYRNLLVQYAAISLGIGGFSILSLFTAITSYNTTRYNRHSRYNEAEGLLVTYITLSAGVNIVGAVVWRSFDPIFLLRAEPETEEVELSPAPVTSENSEGEDLSDPVSSEARSSHHEETRTF